MVSNQGGAQLAIDSFSSNHAMKLSVHELRNQIEAYLSSLNTLLYRFGAGLSTELPLTELHSRFRELHRLETFQGVRELSSAAQPGIDHGSGLRAMLEFLADRNEERIAREANDAISALEKSARIAVENELLSVEEAVTRLPHEPNRGRREQL